MKTNKIEHIIQTVLFEQTARVRVVIKSKFGSAADQLDAREAGAVFGFRIKALPKKTDGRVATASEVQQAIIQAANKNESLKPYANGNYIIIQSEDQRDSEQNYLYNFWVFPKDWLADLQNSAYAGYKDPIDVVVPGRTLWHLDKTAIFNVNSYALITSSPYSLNPVQSKKYAQWYNTKLKKINRKISTADLTLPDFENLPKQVEAPEDFKVVFNNIPKSDTQHWVGVYTYTGIIDAYTEDPINGKLFKDSKLVYAGSFAKSENNMPVLNTGTATDLPYDATLEKTKITANYTGPIQNGYPTDGKIQYELNGDNYEFVGTLKDFSLNTGVEYKNGVLTKLWKNERFWNYETNYSGPVGVNSPKTYIEELQRDIVAMFDNNTEFFSTRTESSLYKAIETLKTTGPTGVWDENMQLISYALNLAVITKEVIIEKQIKDITNVIYKFTHMYIIDHKTQKMS